MTFNKWNELYDTIKELHENNLNNSDIEEVTRFLLNLMIVLDKDERSVICDGVHKNNGFVSSKR